MRMGGESNIHIPNSNGINTRDAGVVAIDGGDRKHHNNILFTCTEKVMPKAYIIHTVVCYFRI